ncbi:MAG: glycine--tRNA ligase subunit beta [Firmicutes bacterium]|nr:glycine--tRNA ligase subunit beta [Bacillota bacterium]
MSKDLLMEIGTEEIPAKFMEPALAQLKSLAERALIEERLSAGEVMTYGTPRRLALYIKELAERQGDLVEEVKGPAKRVAFDEQGQPTKAAQGFARSQGVAVEDLVVKDTGAGEYVFATKRATGSPTEEVLPRLLPALITGLSFPKPMRWGYGELRFARPIRWLVALWGTEVIPFDLEGIKTGRETYGHRFLSQGPLTLKEPVEYLTKLEKAYVIVDQRRRKEMIWAQIQQLAAQHGGWVEPDEELLEEVTHLLEYPTALCGGFSEDYLVLPREVLITTMREHQRYFPVLDSQGNLLPKFITVRNGTADHLSVVQTGNEKVLRARLADAWFFYEEDLKTPLATNVEKLQKIVFQESLGTVYEKVERIRVLVRYLGQKLGLSDEQLADADRAAYLTKADLVTNMVYEFPELQGIMGADYARQNGEKPNVAQAIFEHYLPRHAGDILPASVIGSLVSIADKIDTIVGCFAVGIQPTGSQDPYALRRQALGICHVILNQKLKLSLSDLINTAYSLYENKIKAKLTREDVLREVQEFLRQRIRNILMDRGVTYDVADAVLAAGYDDVVWAELRSQGIQVFRSQPNFAALLTAFTRANNLAKNAVTSEVNVNIFAHKVEQALYDVLVAIQEKVQADLEQERIIPALEKIASLQPVIAEFFEGVMVMVEDEQVRNNRLALLKRISDFMGQIADFSKIVT